MIYCPSNLLSGSPSPPPKVKVHTVVYTYSVLLGGGGAGMLSFVGDHILQEFNTLFLTRFRTYKIATPLQQKPRRGVDLRQINTCRKVPLLVHF
jgi:hypothetical protein